METLRIPARIEAIDVHVHPATEEAEEAGGEYLAALALTLRELATALTHGANGACVSMETETREDRVEEGTQLPYCGDATQASE